MQTNNASFGVSDESTQQLAMSRIRAIEHGRATVQISTVGVSAVIEPNGVVSQQTGLFTAEQMVAYPSAARLADPRDEAGLVARVDHRRPRGRRGRSPVQPAAHRVRRADRIETAA